MSEHTHQIQTGVIAVELCASEIVGEKDTEMRRTIRVIPAADGGELTALDGRRFGLPEGGLMALAEQINRQKIKVRLDFDHESEPSSGSYRGATAARGWLSNFRAADAGMEADVSLMPDANWAIETLRYRYLSPSLMYNARGVIVGMSSVALTNRPALGGETALNQFQPNPNENPIMPTEKLTEQEKALAAREANLAEQEKAMNEKMTVLLAATIDKAVVDGVITAAEKAPIQALAAANVNGIQAGIDELTKVFDARKDQPDAAGEALLSGRVVPAGAPPKAAAVAGDAVPAGFTVTPERAALHAKIQTLSLERGIPYEDAALSIEQTAGGLQ